MFAAILHRRYGSIVEVVREPVLGRPLVSAAVVIEVANSVFIARSSFLVFGACRVCSIGVKHVERLL